MSGQSCAKPRSYPAAYRKDKARAVGVGDVERLRAGRGPAEVTLVRVMGDTTACARRTFSGGFGLRLAGAILLRRLQVGSCMAFT
jgi:hypothetical protein